MDKFLNEMEKERPIRFTDQHLRIATDNYSYLLGSGDFGKVYKGIFSDGTIVAVKVLHGLYDKKMEEQFMAEVVTIGKTHHFNLVRLYGFCLERNLIALVYEYMGNGSLDKYLQEKKPCVELVESQEWFPMRVGKDSRPIMSDVVKMLEGSVENPKPLNPFQPFMDGNFTSHLVQMPLTYITDTSGSSVVVTDSSIEHATPTMRNMPLD
ncbi:hypothetical protein JHK82_042500 [Glycine max]|nr:hypothetical protein JHK82_042500 [Glycine max]